SSLPDHVGRWQGRSGAPSSRTSPVVADLLGPERDDLGDEVGRERVRRIEANDGVRDIEAHQALCEPGEGVAVHDVQADVPAGGADADQLLAVEEERRYAPTHRLLAVRFGADDGGA